MPISRSARFAAATLLAAAVWLSTAVVAVPAHASDSTVSGGRLDWAIKKSFQDYVTGPIAEGSWSLVDGAGTVGDSQFQFHTASGEYDVDSGDFDASYSGGVRFQGHQDDSGTYEMDLTIADPSVQLSGGSGTLYVDIVARHGGQEQFHPGVDFGDLDVAGLDTSQAGDSLALSDVPVTLTANGAAAFDGYYEAGTELDPVSFSGDIQQQEDDSDDADDAEDSADGEFTGAAVDWGVKRTYREFVAGDIADGEWRLDDGAQDGGALFRFPDGEGEFDPDEATLTADFAGSLEFVGEGVDVVFSDLAVDVADDEGVLSATVTTAGEVEEDVALATFEAPDMAEDDDGLLLVDEAPTQLAEGGAAALDDLYQPGDEMDPITLAAPLSADAELPPLPDLGSEPEADAAMDETATDAEESRSPLIALLVAAVLALAAAIAGLWWWRCRRASAAAAPDADAPDVSDDSESSVDADVEAEAAEPETDEPDPDDATPDDDHSAPK